MARRGFRNERFPGASKPRRAKGGIKARSQRGSFGESWWAKRWVAVLETFNIGGRLARGRTYARNGQVLSINISEGSVKARVQGSRPKPYDVHIELTTLSEGDWREVVRVFSQQTVFAAKLLAGEMPQDVEQAFVKAKCSLFPLKVKDLRTHCSCPDWSNPCKHLAAVYYLLGEEFDRDPFLLFKLRGMCREDLLQQLNTGKPPSLKTADGEQPPGAAAETNGKQAAGNGEAVSHPLDPREFWKPPEFPADFWGPLELPPLSAALPQRLGNFPFWRGEAPFLDALTPVYMSAAMGGMEVFLGGPAANREAVEPEEPAEPDQAASVE